MDQTILQIFFEGITQQIQTDIEYTSKVIAHPGEVGRENETVLRDFLTKFLPTRYAVGTGIVIDRFGNRSRQMDIILYDRSFHPDLFARRSTLIFPVDVVYATIEVKTTLNHKEVEDAVDKIASVKRLQVIGERITKFADEDPNTVAIKGVENYPPHGVIFGYDSDIRKAETIHDQLTKTLASHEKQFHPNLGIIVNKGVVFGYEGAPLKQNDAQNFFCKFAGFYAPLPNGKMGWHSTDKDVDSMASTGGRVYPTIRRKNETYPVWPARALLNFLILLYDLLSFKPIIQRGVMRDYLPKEYQMFLDCKEK